MAATALQVLCLAFTLRTSFAAKYPCPVPSGCGAKLVDAKDRPKLTGITINPASGLIKGDDLHVLFRMETPGAFNVNRQMIF